MTEIPEHLRKRAEEAKAKAAAKAAEGAAPAEAAPAAAASASDADSKIPAHLLERAKAARAKAAGGEAEAAVGGGTAVATAASPAAPAQSGPPLAAGPGGHTQRLLTVVKSGSIQDVKASPQDKVHVWPHLLSIEFVAALMCLGFTLVFSIFVNAPLLELADINKTPNPSKAPWYFLGLQEMLTMFHPMVAGVLLPGMGMAGLMFAPTSTATLAEAREPQVRDLALHHLHDGLRNPHHHRLVLPRPRAALHLPVGRGPLLRAVGGRHGHPRHRHPGHVPRGRLRDLHVATPP
jgi:hypothetical protein